MAHVGFGGKINSNPTGSYVKPRALLWSSGVIIFLIMMATAFLGYVLPWGQMSFWGATVIVRHCVFF